MKNSKKIDTSRGRARLAVWMLAPAFIVLLAPACGGKKSRAAVPPVTNAPAPTSPSVRVELPRAEPEPTPLPVDPPAQPEVTKPPVEFTEPSLTDEPPDSLGVASLAGQIVLTALAQIGVPYVWGGADPGRGFDCSGLVQWAFKQHGIELPRSTRQQFRAGRSVPRSKLEPGDLLFYAWGRDRSKVTHVGIYVGDGSYIHSPGTGRSVYRAEAFDRAHSRRFLGARRVDAASRQASQTTSEEAPTWLRYVVRKGDYIWALARRFKVSPQLILESNGLGMDDILKVGQKLLIPLTTPDR